VNRVHPKGVAGGAYRRARLAYGRVRHVAGWTGIRILGYHRISPDQGDLSVDPQRFRQQMEELASADVEVVALARAIELLEAGPVDERYVCITFDDAYRDVLEKAMPILEELRFPATIFVPTGIVDGTASYYWFAQPPAALSWAELDGLVSGGLVDAQAHSRTHPWLPSLDVDAARDEIVGSKLDLEQRLGRLVTSFCFPAGVHGDREIELVRAAGFRAAVTTDPGVNREAGSLAALRRTLIFGRDSPSIFSAKLAGLLDHPSLVYRQTQRRRRSRVAPGYVGGSSRA
jgi:peptidoglycan/xylan/chitin deacetylase (PgdA/CDA1 family)